MRLQRAVDLLESGTDADSLAAAGLLNSVKDHDRSLRLIEQATTDAPERADLVWLQIQFCQAVPACDSVPMEERLRSLDARNGAGWISALARANKANDEQASSAALAAISRSERLDIYWTTSVARLSRATAETKAVSLTEAEIFVIGILAAQAIPAYQVLSAVWPENSPQWKEATEARRSWEYRAKFLSESEAWNAAHTDEYLALCAQNRREQDVYKAELIATGKSPDPPPN